MCNHSGFDVLKPKHGNEVRMRRGKADTIVPFCDPAALWESEEGKTERTRQTRECREAKGGCTKGWSWHGSKYRKEVRREMLVLRSHDGASGVVEILQQCASSLLSNVHLILQVPSVTGAELPLTSHHSPLIAVGPLHLP